MGVERPEHDDVRVDVDTMGGVAAGLKSVLGLTGWAPEGNTGVKFGSAAAFSPAGSLGSVQTTAMKVAAGVVKRIEAVNTRYAAAVGRAVDGYGADDRHSAGAVNAAAEGMSDPKV